MNLYSDDDERYSHASELCGNNTLHCYKCGFVLLNIRPESQGTIWDKCTNKACRKTNRFIEAKGKIKLLTKNVVAKISSEELYPYTKDDMLELVIK